MQPKLIHRPDGLHYTVAETPQPDVATFANEEILLLHDQRPLPDEMAHALILIKTQFPGSRIKEARSWNAPTKSDADCPV